MVVTMSDGQGGKWGGWTKWFIQQFTMGKGLENKKTITSKHRSGAEQRKKQGEARSNEWDIRVTVCSEMTIEDVVQKLHKYDDKILYCLVGGEELGKAWQQKKEVDPYTLEEIEDYKHHHVCLVLYEETSYKEVCRMIGMEHRIGKYVVPRNKSYTYAGWVIHATKTKTKTDPGERQVKEWGTRPIDDSTDENKKRIRYMIMKYGDTEAKLTIGIVPRAAKKLREQLKRERSEQRDERKKASKKQKTIERLKKQLAELEKEEE